MMLISIIFSIDWEMYRDIYSIIQQSQEETRDRDTCNESPSSKTTEDIASDSSSNTTEDIAAENEVQVASRHMLTSSQVNPIPFILARIC
jgi:hypothetical protein